MDEHKEPLNIQTVGKIQPIDGETVHRICSGQVVLNLAVAVKELVENSLDAGATSIDVRLRNYGTELIEVSDNGCGVTEDNFSALTLKHHTSKLSEYSDLLNVASFGFRGEALSSLCALSDLTITTKHASAEFATKIEYDHKGCIIKTTPCSRQVGTTVTLTNLFSTLPVRLKEFQKNSKREFNKMTQLLYAYCLISVGVKITCTNQTSSNAKSVVVATQGSKSIKENIASVFGFKQLQSVLEIKPHYVPNIKDNILRGLSSETEYSEVSNDLEIEEVEIDLSEDSNDNDRDETLTQESVRSQKSQGHKNSSCPVSFDAFISSCAHGSGRSSTDRQFYYVNARPCEPPKVIKLINEVYRQFNGNQYPFVLLNINLDRTSVDVNVTPDKRKVFLTKEKAVLDVIKSSMLKVFEDIPRTVKVEKPLAISSNNRSSGYIEENSQNRLHSFLNKFASKNTRDNNNKDAFSVSKTKTDLKRKSSSMLDFVSSKTIRTNDYVNENDESVNDDDIETNDIRSNNSKRDQGSPLREEKHTEDCEVEEIKRIEPETYKNQEILFLEATDTVPQTQIRQLDEVIIEKSHTIKCKPDKVKLRNYLNSPSKSNVSSTTTSKSTIVTDKRDLGRNNRKTVQLKTSIEHVKALTEIYNNQKEKKDPDKVKFRTGINPVFNKTCEEELSKEISKDSFKQMQVIGQFNLGFIIARLDDDLFIIDQHATDEIYNFETLQKTTELTNQKLVIPQQLELTGVNEQTLMDNLEVFKKNGFTFEINEHELPTKRVKLLTIPMSKNWVFGKSDIEELLFMLREAPSEYCRPSRVRAMFASRACRKSVMIGTALDKADMKRLVDHMAEIDKPWNCPHGRPTIRHLVNLAVVHIKDD